MLNWYDMIAKKNGGMKTTARFVLEGLSGEDVFEKRLLEYIKNTDHVLDAGCGNGEFTLNISKYCAHITGFDSSREMLKLAQGFKEELDSTNADFVLGATKYSVPFEDNRFDLIYVRNGPINILHHMRILKRGGRIIGVNSGAIEIVRDLLTDELYSNIEITEYDTAVMYFENIDEFAKILTDSPGNRTDFSLPENREALSIEADNNTIDGRIAVKQWRYVWTAIKR